MTRWLTVAWTTCLVAATWTAALTPRATGYDLSLSDAYPPLFWALTICASIFAAAIPFILAARRKTSRWWVSGLVGVVATNMLVLSLPLFRGYPVNDRTDAMLHIGHTQDLLASGSLGSEDFYPAMHFLELGLQTIAGLSPGDALIVLNLTFAAIWTLGIVLLAWRLAGNIFGGYLAVAFSAPFSLLMYQSYTLPSTLSAMLVPILFAIYLRGVSARTWAAVPTVICVTLLGLLLVVFHPVTTVYVIVEMLGLVGGAFLYARIRIARASARNREAIPFQFGGAAPMQVLGISLLTWSLSFPAVSENLGTVIRFLLGAHQRGSAASAAVAQVQQAQSAHLPLRDLVSILWNAFGLPVLVVSLVLVFTAVLLYRSVCTRRLPPPTHVAFLSAYVMTGVMMVGTLSVNSPERYPTRLLRMLVILGLCALAWWSWEAAVSTGFAHWPHLGRRLRRIAVGCLVGILAYMVVLGQMNVYAHPRNGQPNEQVTRHELSGMDWLIHHRPRRHLQASLLPSETFPYQGYFLGYQGMWALGPDWWRDDMWLPSHFYWKEWRHCMARIAPGMTTYLALSEVARIAPLRFPKSVRSEAHIYTTHDWQVLSQDPSVNKIYDNGRFEVWVTNKRITTCR